MKALIITIFIVAGANKCNGYQTRYKDKDTHNFQRQKTPREAWKLMILDTYKEGKVTMGHGLEIMLKNRFSAPFEVGYLYCSLQDRYRRMVDKYQTALMLVHQMYLMEETLYLADIELEYWTIEHMVNAAHQLEKKYLILNSLTDPYKDTLLTRRTTASLKMPNMSGIADKHTRRSRTRSFTRTPRLKHPSDFENRWSSALTRSRDKRFWWPIEYGWEIDWDWNDDPNFKDDIKYFEKSDPNFTVTAPPSYEETDPVSRLL